MVAMGSADAYYEYGLHCWDMAAAHLIVREAGGVCMYPTGKQLDNNLNCAGAGTVEFW